jgi:ubiquinone/menaquinone biosynthesis C-methylase UbiE
MTNQDQVDTRPSWDKIAWGYNEFVTPSHFWLGCEGLRRAGLHAGMRFLDVAAGTGALSIPAARLGAQVLATDQSLVMLEMLAERASEEGLNVETRVMDGQALTLADNSFDLVGSQFGVMLFPDMPKGIREMVRTARHGGRILLIAYGDPRRIEFLSFLIGAIQAVRPDYAGLPMDPPPLPLQLREPERLREEFTAAGLRDVRIETITETLEFRTGNELWGWLVWSNPIVEHVLGSLGIANDERDAIQNRLDQMVRERGGPGSGVARLTNPINIGIGTK